MPRVCGPTFTWTASFGTRPDHNTIFLQVKCSIHANASLLHSSKSVIAKNMADSSVTPLSVDGQSVRSAIVIPKLKKHGGLAAAIVLFLLGVSAIVLAVVLLRKRAPLQPAVFSSTQKIGTVPAGGIFAVFENELHYIGSPALCEGCGVNACTPTFKNWVAGKDAQAYASFPIGAPFAVGDCAKLMAKQTRPPPPPKA